MRVLMLGWELPPHFAGGVGVVCDELTRSLAARGVRVTYVMPSGPEFDAPHVDLVVAERYLPGVTVERVPGALTPYADLEPALRLSPTLDRVDPAPRALYGNDLLHEMEVFAERVRVLAERLPLEFDVIHAHDWTTFPAALALKEATGKPLVVHVHITEFDKSGGDHADSRVYAVEKRGMQGADLVVAVSRRTRDQCVRRYGIPGEKVEVVYNGIRSEGRERTEADRVADRLVLFLGRVTLQKGPEYFVEAARRVLDVRPNVTFVLAGTGDMLPRMIERSAELGLGPRMLFAGFVGRDRVAELYRRADCFVMPSVSEPFGIVPLEAMDSGIPVLVSRQSGISEMLRHALKFDAWDVDDLAAKILATLAYPSLRDELRRGGRREVAAAAWDGVAGRVQSLYDRLCGGLVHA